MKIKNLVAFAALALGAVAMPFAGHAAGDANGDICSLDAVNKGVTVIFPNKSNPLRVGEEAYILVRLLNQDYDQGDDSHPWMFLPTSTSLDSKYLTSYMYVPKISLSVGGKPAYAEYSDYGPNGEKSGQNANFKIYTDFYFRYTVQPGDIGLPVKLMCRDGKIPGDGSNTDLDLVNVNTETIQLATNPWKLGNLMPEGGRLVNFHFGPEDPPGDPFSTYPSAPHADGPHRNYSLENEGIFVQTIDFDPNYADPEATPEKVWREVWPKSVEYVLAAPKLEGVGPAAVWVWSENPEVFDVSGEASDITTLDGTNYLKVSIGASTNSVTFRLKGGTAAVGATAKIFMGTTTTPERSKVGDVLEGSTVSRTIRMANPPPPNVKVTFDTDGLVTTRKVDPVPDCLAEEMAEKNLTVPIYVTLSETFPSDFHVRLKVTLNDDPACDVFTNKVMGLSASNSSTGYLEAYTNVAVKAGTRQFPIYLYPLGADGRTLNGITIQSEIVEAAAKEKFQGDILPLVLTLRDVKPTVVSPTSADSLSADKKTGCPIAIEVRDCYRDLNAPQTYTVEYSWDAGTGGSTNGVSFRAGQPTTVNATGFSSKATKVKLRVTDAQGNASAWTDYIPVMVEATKTVKPELVREQSETAPAIEVLKFAEGDTAFLRFRIDPETAASMSDMYAFLVPLNEASSNLVTSSAFTEGVPFEAEHPVSKVVSTAALTFLDGCAAAEDLRFGVTLRTENALTNGTEITAYTPQTMYVSVTNRLPRVLTVEKNNDVIPSGGEGKAVAAGVKATFKATLDDYSVIDITNKIPLVTYWYVTDGEGAATEVFTVTSTVSSVNASAMFEYTFQAAGENGTVQVAVRDKDMTDKDLTLAPRYSFTLPIKESPYIYFTDPTGHGVVEGENLEFYENVTKSKGYINVNLSEAPGSETSKTKPLLVKVSWDSWGADGVVTSETDTVSIYGNSTTAKLYLDLKTLDGGQDTMYNITAEVLNTTSNKYGVAWKDYYVGRDSQVIVHNVDPKVQTVTSDTLSLSETSTNSATLNVEHAIKWSVSDIVPDTTNGLKVTWSGSWGFYRQQTTKDMTWSADWKTAFGVISNVAITAEGTQSLTMTVEDKDGGASNPPKTWWFYIMPTKKVVVTPFGPAGSSQSKYDALPSALRGKGRVYTAATRSTQSGFRHTFYFDVTEDQTELYAFGYPAGAGVEDNGDLVPAGYDIKLNANGGTWTTGNAYYKPRMDYDSFFYCWIDLSQEAAIREDLNGVPKPSAAPSNEVYAVVKHEKFEGKSDKTYETKNIEAIFSRELYASDNMGDINQDGIPDLYVSNPLWKGGMLGGVMSPDCKSLAGNDLAQIDGLNADGDVIPAMDTSKLGTFIPDLEGTWATFGSPFDAITEIRGYHWGLNDAPAQAHVAGTPDRIYEVDGKWDEEKCTISYVEYLAWKDSGLPAEKWSPERPSDPTVDDTDEDGMPDGYEYFFWYRAHVGYIDADGTHKYLTGRRWNPTDPQHPDLIPPSEIEQIMDPINPGDKASINYRDTDNDGLPDLIEFERGTNPFDYDTDGDGLPDGYEVFISETDPLDPTIGDALLNPDGDQMAFLLQEKWHLVGVLNKEGGIDYYVAPELSADGVTNGFTAVDSGVTNSYTLVSALDAAGETVKYVTTAAVSTYTNADDVICLVGGLPAGKTWLLAKVGDANVRGRATSLVKGAALEAEPEEIELNVLVSTNAPATYYKAWFYEQEKIKGKLVDVFIRGAEFGAKTDPDPLAAEGLEVVDVRDDAYVALVHFYAYQETCFDARVAWKDPGAAIDEKGTTRRYAHRDELYLLTFLYHANLLTAADLTPTLQRPWKWIWETYATDPNSCDTDSDGAPDGWELYVFAGPKKYEKGKLVIGYNWTYPRLFPGCAFSPIYAYNGEPAAEDFKADGDGLSEIQEFSGIESVAEYAGKPGAEAIVVDDPLWTNKKWPTDPWNGDTDNDGLGDAEEQKAFRHNGGLNPLSWDTDADGLPDPWEAEFAGTATIGGAGTNSVASAGGSTNATASATNAPAAAASWTWNEDGMDGTVDDAMKDYDHDGLRNWQEYMVGAMRCWRYDDITSPWTVNVGDVPDPADGEKWYNVLLNPESPDFNPGLSDFILDPGLYFSCATNAYEQGGVLGKFYMLKDGYYHDLKIDAGDKEKNNMNRWVRNLADPLLAEAMKNAYPAKYICCDPRRYDTDDDGMDDYYELFHGLNPLLGPEIDIVAQAWGNPKFPLCAVVNNWYENMPAVPTRPDKPWLAKGQNDRDFFQLPWLAGLPDADPDGDNIRNQQEAIFSNVQAASTYLHIDPTPLWMTDGQYEDSLTYRYYHISTPNWGIQPKIWMPPKPYFEYKGQRYFWKSFPWIDYDEKTGICSMIYSINNWKVMDYMFSFEENEGYDSDHDYLGDFEEGQGKTKSASDPQVSDSPLRRQAMWFGGEADKGFLETTLPVEEMPAEEAGAEARQNLLYYTVECWAKPDESTYAKPGLQTLVERAIMSGPGNAGDETWLRKNFVLGLRNGRWYTRFDSTGTDANQPVEIAGGPEVTTNWTHVAATYDGTALRLYVNGVCTPATTQYTSIQPEHGVNAIYVNGADDLGNVTNIIDAATGTGIGTFAGTFEVDFAGDRGLGVPQIAMLVGASAVSGLGVTFDYQWQTRSIMMFGYPRGINTMTQTTMGAYGNFYRGYIDEVRVWDGARRADDIRSDYEQRVRYDSAKALENREKVFKSWAKGGSRLDHATEQLPPQLMYHWSFDHVAGAVDRADVMRVPAGFDTALGVVDSMAIWSRPLGWSSFWLDEGVNGTLWQGQVFSDHAWQPWVTDTISHLPRFDGTVVDSVYWSEDFAGAMPVASKGYAKLQFPRNAEVPSRWTQMLYAEEGEAWAEDVRWDIIAATGDEELMQKYVFARRNMTTVGGDLMIFGSAYPKRISAAEGGMWDEQGPADAWAQTGSDADHNGLPDWWEEYARENYGVDPFTPIDWTTSVNYEGRTMPAWEAYLRDLSRGLTVVNGVAKVRGEYADSRDVDMDGIPDWWEDLYHVDTQSTADTLADPDGDGLGNFTEYIISEKFGFAQLNPRDPKTDGVCVDYFRRVGDLYLGEIFTDHDQVDDVWEDKYAGFADFYAYDPSRDDDGDGWSNWAEQKAGTDPRLVKETGIDDYTLAGYPVPCIRARIVNNGLTVETAPVVIKAWSERRDPGMTGDPDATWTVSGSAKGAEGAQQQTSGADGEQKAGAEMGESSKYLGIKPDGTRTLTLGPGAIERNSVKIFYKDLSFCKAQIVGDMIIPTEIGSESEAQWYYLVHDREGKLYTTGGIFADEQEVGTVDYDTGAVTIDFGNDALCGISLGDPGTTAGDGETPTYDLLNLDQSYVLVTWNSSARSGSLNRTLYLSDADDQGDISGRFDHVREGLNTFIAFVDRDGDGAYTAGEPYGFVRGVDVGWSGAEFEIELTETSPVFARVNVFGGASGGGSASAAAVSDRQVLWGTSCADTPGSSTGSNDTWGVSANAYDHVRIVPYMVAGVYTDGEGSNSFVYAVDYVENRVVAEFDVRSETKPYITEADFIRDGAFDIDWDGFSTSAFANNSRLTSAVGEVTAVKYRVIFGNEGPIGAESNLDSSTPGVSSFHTLIERRFERTADRTKPTGLSVDGVVCGAQPLFGWRLDEPTDVQVYANPNTGVTSYVEPAARYGCSYTAFEIQVADRDGNVVYDSGVVRTPVRDADGFFRWTPTNLYAGDQTALGKVFAATGNWQWRVAMYNSKFKPNVRETMNGWSAWQPFSTSVGTGNTLGDLAREAIDVSVKYTGPVKVLDGCEDLSKTKGTVRLQAFVSPDFSGEPVAQGFVTNRASLVDVADTAANGRLIGLMPGEYYLRAYVDTNGNLVKDDWESWGAAAEAVTVGPGIKVPDIRIYIEDADTDQDWIPDAWEMQVNGSLTKDNVYVLPDGQIKFKLIYPETKKAAKTSLKSAAAPVTFFQNLNAVRFVLTSEATDSDGDALTDILAATQPKAVPGTVAITSLALDANKGEAVLKVTGETEKSDEAELLDAIYVFPDQPLTLNVYRKNSLAEKDWTLVKENIPVILGSGTEEEVRVSLGDEIDPTSGFYMIKVVQ